MSLLDIVKDAMELCEQPSPSTVFLNNDATVRQFKTLSQVEGDELSRAHDWRDLKVSATMAGDGTSTDFVLPSDFDRFHPGITWWRNNTPDWPLIGPVTDEQWLAQKAAGIQANPPIWRFFGPLIEFYPAPPVGESYSTEYRSSFWVASADRSKRRNRWAADTDISILPERIMVLGIIWRWKKSKGFDYAEDFRSYELAKARAGLSDGGRPVIRLMEGYEDIRRARRNDVRVIVS